MLTGIGITMPKIIALLIIFPVLAFAGLPSLILSQARIPGQSFQQAVERVSKYLPKQSRNNLKTKDSAYDKRTVIENMDFSLAPEITNYEQFMQLFYVIRDSRFLHTGDNPQFARRISWLYPDDGCFARAALAGIKLDEEHLIRPAKIFAFGNLTVETPYSPSGSVYWWYHVAPVVQYMGSVYVLDPAINNEAPILVDDWYSKMGNVTNLKSAVCNAYTYYPFDKCTKATEESDGSALHDESYFLESEWERMTTLGFDPIAYLGTNPPWIMSLPDHNVP